MVLKHFERVVYGKNPLINVTCQLRFPRILLIDEKPPIDFQEGLRQEYPVYDKITEQAHHIQFNPTQNPQMFHVPVESTTKHIFASEDNIWTINLTGTFVSLSTTHYTEWGEFTERLKTPLELLEKIYKPNFFERIGLRYINAFRRSLLGLADVQWDELIMPFALGFLSCADFKEAVAEYTSTSMINLDNNAKARIITALGYVGDEITEPSFIVDTDLFFEKKSIPETMYALNELHGHSTNIIRSIIKEKLHEAMMPTQK
jgi:uncharacterized protein (TIGR04255 family)